MAVHARRRLAAPSKDPRALYRRSGEPSSCARVIRRRGSVCEVGKEKRCRRKQSGSCAARGGLDGAPYAWGDEFRPQDRHLANTWQGEFPWQNLVGDGYERTSPIGTFPPNGYGLIDMIGNTWRMDHRLVPPETSERSRERRAVFRTTPGVDARQTATIRRNRPSSSRAR